MAFFELEQIHFIQNRVNSLFIIRKRIVLWHADEDFFFDAFCKKLMIYVLHDHIAQLQALLAPVLFCFLLQAAAAPLFQTA